ncbi:4-hydroxy-tetrahydrodipicolinate synthase [Candidatus Gracilibacteria bacterium]|nr:4-hydroxy-tetrahydrodipicolinate synthase [Candidatus Gracilibacteria bacterium]
MRKYSGTWTALITPFRGGMIDFDAVGRLVEMQIEGGVTGILLAGTTGESPCLDGEENGELLARVREMVDGRCLIMVGCGTNCTSKSVANAVECEDADVLMVVNPYYNKPTQEGLYQHFKAVADAVDKPILLYNIMGRTGVNLETETLLKLARECSNIIGVKEASGNMEQMKEVIAGRPREDFIVMSGDDGLTLELIGNGGDGVVSVASNIVPGKVSEMVKFALEGNMEEAGKINSELARMFDEIFMETNPIPIKYCASKMGLCDLEYRLPMCAPSSEACGKLDEMIKNYNLGIKK